ncbi:Two-component system chemotaxis response regulator CheY [uncultured Gammaproteobacteria bacterium]
MAGVDYGRLKVLVVDDEEYTRRIIRQLLHQMGVRSIGEASNGKDALLETLRTRPDIVFLDVHMKPVGGIEVLRQLRAVKIADLARTPVIMVTGDANPGTVGSAKDLAANGYLVKPVALSALKVRIDAVLGAAAAASGRPNELT